MKKGSCGLLQTKDDDYGTDILATKHLKLCL